MSQFRLGCPDSLTNFDILVGRAKNIALLSAFLNSAVLPGKRQAAIDALWTAGCISDASRNMLLEWHGDAAL